MKGHLTKKKNLTQLRFFPNKWINSLINSMRGIFLEIHIVKTSTQDTLETVYTSGISCANIINLLDKA